MTINGEIPMARIKKNSKAIACGMLVLLLATFVGAQIISDLLSSSFTVSSDFYPLTLNWGAGGDPSSVEIKYDQAVAFSVVAQNIATIDLYARLYVHLSAIPSGFSATNCKLEYKDLDQTWKQVTWNATNEALISYGNNLLNPSEVMEYLLRVTFLSGGVWKPSSSWGLDFAMDRLIV
jgi:hypothetical protein